MGGVLKDRKLSERKSVQKKSEVKAWLILFARHIGDKLPDEQVTVLPYRQIKPIWVEYKDDLLAGEGFFGQPCKLSHFRAIFNEVTVSLEKHSPIEKHRLICDMHNLYSISQPSEESHEL